MTQGFAGLIEHAGRTVKHHHLLSLVLQGGLFRVCTAQHSTAQHSTVQTGIPSELLAFAFQEWQAAGIVRLWYAHSAPRKTASVLQTRLLALQCTTHSGMSHHSTMTFDHAGRTYC